MRALAKILDRQRFIWILFILVALQFTVACTQKVKGEKAEHQSDDISDSCPKQVTDFDGSQYTTVIIGSQCWMTENLRSAHYKDGTRVEDVWAYEGNENNVQRYGRLYRWTTVSHPAGICPKNWHVPSDEDFKVLERFTGLTNRDIEGTGWRRTNNESRMIKKHDYAYFWSDDEKKAVNFTGFSALPAGVRTADGSYTGLGSYVDYWTSTEADNEKAWNRSLVWIALHPGSDEVYRKPIDKEWGFSIRCIKN